jgi:hypothetical protein
MDQDIKSLLKCLGMTALAFILLNLIAPIVRVIFYGLGETWSFNFKHGSFYIDGKPAGFTFESPQAILLMTLVFFFYAYKEFRKGNFTF